MHSSYPDGKLPKLLLIPMVVPGRVFHTFDPELWVFQYLVLDRFYFFYRCGLAPLGGAFGGGQGSSGVLPLVSSDVATSVVSIIASAIAAGLALAAIFRGRYLSLIESVSHSKKRTRP